MRRLPVPTWFSDKLKSVKAEGFSISIIVKTMTNAKLKRKTDLCVFPFDSIFLQIFPVNSACTMRFGLNGLTELPGAIAY